MSVVAVRSTVLSLLLEQTLHGEWWIEDGGHVEYADGDIGDQNHESIAFGSALGLDLEELQWEVNRDDEAILDIVKQDLVLSAEVAEAVGKHIDQVEPEDVTAFFTDIAQDIMPGDLDDMQAAVLLGAGATEEAVKFFNSRSGDARDYQMLTNNWIRVQGSNFQMGVFDNDAKSRIAEFLFDPIGFDPDKVQPDEEFITIEELQEEHETFEADVYDILDPHKMALQVKKKYRLPAGAVPGMYSGGGPAQL